MKKLCIKTLLILLSLSSFAGSDVNVSKITGSYSLQSGDDQCPTQLEIYSDNGSITFNVSHSTIFLDSINEGYDFRLDYHLLNKYCYKSKLSRKDTKLTVYRGEGFSGVPCAILAKKVHVIELDEESKTMEYYFDGVGIYRDQEINCRYNKLDW